MGTARVALGFRVPTRVLAGLEMLNTRSRANPHQRDELLLSPLGDFAGLLGSVGLLVSNWAGVVGGTGGNHRPGGAAARGMQFFSPGALSNRSAQRQNKTCDALMCCSALVYAVWRSRKKALGTGGCHRTDVSWFSQEHPTFAAASTSDKCFDLASAFV